MMAAPNTIGAAFCFLISIFVGVFEFLGACSG